MAEALLDAGADVNAKDTEGFTAIRYAIIDRNEALIKLLVARSADLNIQVTINLAMSTSYTSAKV